jgi:hypothetical protein
MISVSDPLRVRFFSQSLTGPAFGWYTSLGRDLISTWKQLEEQFHIQYHSEAVEAGIADLAQVRQKRGETVAEYIQCFREVKNQCYSIRISEKEAVELASLGLVKPIRDLAFQLEFNSLAHLVQKLTTYDQRHPELYQDKFKRQVTLIDTEDAEDSGDDQEVAVAELTRGANPDEDIATNDTSTLTPVSTSTTPLGPITCARARWLTHQVSLLFSSGSSYLENRDICTLVLLRNNGLNQKVRGIAQAGFGLQDRHDL